MSHEEGLTNAKGHATKLSNTVSTFHPAVRSVIKSTYRSIEAYGKEWHCHFLENVRLADLCHDSRHLEI